MNFTRRLHSLCLLIVATWGSIFAQSTLIGTVTNNIFEPVDFAHVMALDALSKELYSDTYTNEKGEYTLSLAPDQSYILIIDKHRYFDKKIQFQLDTTMLEMNIPLDKKPGYLFDVTVFEEGKGMDKLVKDTKIEIYNNTTQKEALVLDSHPKSAFHFRFEEGNHYTLLVRKNGYLNKRIEAFVDIKGCILCLDGLGIEQPDVVNVMTGENQLGFFLGNIAMKPIEVGTTFRIDNIYYDYNQSDIRSDAAAELDKVVAMLKDNPGISIELSAHTDARGSDAYNLSLSEQRAKAAVDYLVEKGGLDPSKLTYKGYGETQLVNKCDDGVNCTGKKHQENRRTELKITGIDNKDPLEDKSLKEIIEDPNLYRKIIDKTPKENILTLK